MESRPMCYMCAGAGIRAQYDRRVLEEVTVFADNTLLLCQSLYNTSFSVLSANKEEKALDFDYYCLKFGLVSYYFDSN